MRIFLTAARGATFDRHFPAHLLNRLSALGTVEANPFERPLTHEELKRLAAEADILLTHWGTPQVDADALDALPRLRLLAHGTGTVAHIASEALYARGIPVISANAIMAKYVAEGVLGDLIAAQRLIPQLDAEMKAGCAARPVSKQRSLFHSEIGLIGLGTVGRELLRLLAPFDCRAFVYDPYLPANALAEWPFAEAVPLARALACPVVSIHAAQTPETYHLIDAQALRAMPDGALLVNTARGSLVDTQALIPELRSGRLRAALDVYEREDFRQTDAALMACGGESVFQPHMAGAAAGAKMTEGIIEDIERFLRGEPLKLRVSIAQFRLMTQE